MAKKRIEWTDEIVDYLREIYPYKTNKECVQILYEKFGIEANTANIIATKKRYGLPDKVIENTGMFKKGDSPWNKGIPMRDETRDKLKDTWFQKGCDFFSRPLGDERVDRDGYIRVKIKQPNVWVLKNRYLYEQAHNVKLKDDEVVLFADQDKTNFNIDNLIKVNRKDLLCLCKNDLIFENAELTKTGVNIARLNTKIYERRKEE